LFSAALSENTPCFLSPRNQFIRFAARSKSHASPVATDAELVRRGVYYDTYIERSLEGLLEKFGSLYGGLGAGFLVEGPGLDSYLRLKFRQPWFGF
jgi:hypothetical protein